MTSIYWETKKKFGLNLSLHVLPNKFRKIFPLFYDYFFYLIESLTLNLPDDSQSTDSNYDDGANQANS